MAPRVGHLARAARVLADDGSAMPHFVLDVSKPFLEARSPDELIRAVHDTARASGLFAEEDIKVRV